MALEIATIDDDERPREFPCHDPDRPYGRWRFGTVSTNVLAERPTPDVSPAAAVRGKTYVVDTSVLVSAPDALHRLVGGNTVIIPFAVLQELDKRRTDSNGVGYTARQTIRALDQLQAGVSCLALRSGITWGGGQVQFDSGDLDPRPAWPGFNPSYADDRIIHLASTYQRAHLASQVVVVTRDAAMRCKARARGIAAEDYYSDHPVPSPDTFYSGRTQIEVPVSHAHLLSTLHNEQRLPIAEFASFSDVSTLLANQCCELRVSQTGRHAWGIYKDHDGVGYLRRVNTKVNERFGPCNAEQACARDLMLDDQALLTSLVGIAGTGKTLMALMCAYELYRRGRVATIEVYRLNAEAGRELGFLPGALGDKMAPWAKPVLDNLDFIVRRMAPAGRFGNSLGDDRIERRDHGAQAHATAEDLIKNNVLEVAPINYLRGRSIHDAVIVVDDGQNLTQEDMKLVLTRAGDGTRVILTGDPDQIDWGDVDALSNGLVQVVERFKGEPTFAHLTMKQVVRSQIAQLAATRL